MAFMAICYTYINLFALQHIADRPGEYRGTCTSTTLTTTMVISKASHQGLQNHAYIDGSCAVDRIGLSYSANLSK